MDVYVLPWQVRSVRGVRWKPEDGETLTRIEFSDGGTLDVDQVLERIGASLRAVLGSVAK